MKGNRRIRHPASHALIALAVAGGVASGAAAQMPGYNGNNQSQRVWSRMDACKRQAWKAHPDYTREDSTKRAEALRRCLEASSLPPVAPIAPVPASPPERSGTSR